jgi:hypothetical protein
MIALVLHDLSRFDKENNLINSGPAEQLCIDTFAAHGIDYEKDVWVTVASAFGKEQPPAPISHYIFAGPRCVELLPDTKGRTLDAVRGLVRKSKSGTPYILTYWPTDACDLFAIENELAGMEDDGENDRDGDGKSTSPTKRSNYRFWFQRDVAKLLTFDGVMPPEPRVTYCQSTDDALDVFRHEGPIFLDIECNPADNTLLCMAITCGPDAPIYAVPIYDWRLTLRTGPRFFARLAIEMRRRRTVIHNALFDLMFLALHYRLPFGEDIYCTMVAGHRIWPEAEKSLAHCQTLYTNRPFHKDEGGTWNPRNGQQYRTLIEYNVKDVVALREIYYGQQRVIAQDEGLKASVDQAMSSLFDYAYMSLQGLRVDTVRRGTIIKQSKERFDDLQRVLDLLVGRPLNPASPDQVVRYLHEDLRYRPEKWTATKQPSVAGDALYKIKIKHPDNVVLDVIIEMRRMAKLGGMLGFQDWYWET